ncbi:MAG: hypothetical protein QOJ50_1422 [Cryptosporangiaceae bacterium]|jgi:DNA-binding FadR family transcriptional regulator|nr:hypothetical protein [Cryptosporangiaceae bacterium]
MNRDERGEAARDVAAVSDPGELLELQAAVQRYLAALAAMQACETDLVRLTAAAKAAGLADDEICDRFGELGVAADQLPRGLRVTLGYTGPDA